MKIAICDDEQLIIKKLEEYLCAKGDLYSYVDADVLLYQSDEIFFDIVLLDIELGGTNGIEVARCLRKKHPEILLIFMTGFHQYVYDVFEVQPIGFLRKPFHREDVKRVFEQAAKRCNKASFLEVSISHGLKRIELKNILYIESDKRKIHLMTIEGEVVFYGRMDEVEEKLQKISCNFWRISQSVIINATFIREINSEAIKIAGYEGILSISRSYRERIQEKVFELHKIH